MTTPSATASEWGEETTTVYSPEPKRRETQTWGRGQNLDAIFERSRRSGVPLPTAFVFALYTQTCAELAGPGRRPARHKEDRHPDPVLGPERIMVGFDGQVKVDWTAREESSVRAPMQRARSYQSPEQARGLPTNGRSDLFSLALSIAELFVLKRLSDGRGAITESEGGSEFADILRAGKRVPRDLGSILLRSLAREVEQRPFGVTSLLEDLNRIGDRLDMRAHPSITASHMRRLFFESPAPPPEPEPPPAPEPATAAAPVPTPELPPPPPPPRVSIVSLDDIFVEAIDDVPPLPIPDEPPTLVPPPRPPPVEPAPLPLPALSTLAAPESEPPPALARTLPPVAPQRRPFLSSLVSESSTLTVTRPMKAAFGAGLLAMLLIPYLKSGPGKVFSAVTGRLGEPLASAAMLVDGEPKCSGPKCSFDVPAGVHEVTARAEGYIPQMQLVAVRERESAAVNFRLERNIATIKVSGNPEGAIVLVDGERKGRLPLEIEVAPGAHRVRVDADHFSSEERSVDAPLGESKSIDVVLRPHVGRATLDVRTPGADIALVSGSDRKEHLDPAKPVELDLSRPWVLEASRPGFQPVRMALEWGGALERTFVVSLPKIGWAVPKPMAPVPQRAVAPSADDAAPASNESCVVTLNSIPSANVYVDNVRLGVTPLLKVKVRPGNHVAQFVQGDSKKWRSFVCSGGESKVVVVGLSH